MTYDPAVPATPVILIPPSEGKAAAGDGDPFDSARTAHPQLDGHRRKVGAALRKAMSDQASAGRLLGVKNEALAAARSANRHLWSSPTLPAIDRYTGVLYEALDHSTLPARSRRRAATQVRILSGLFGVLAPSDPIPDYKIKMGASLPGIGRLATSWRPHVTAALAPVVDGRTVWDLLPNEHSAAWSPADCAPSLRIAVTFCDRRSDGRLVTVSHWNKLLKGALVRHVLATQLDHPDGLTDFDHPLGYRYDPARTTEDGGLVQVVLVADR